MDANLFNRVYKEIIRKSNKILASKEKHSIYRVINWIKILCWKSYFYFIIYKIEKVPGFYIIAGHEENGIDLVPLTRKIISQMIADEKRILLINLLTVSRF